MQKTYWYGVASDNDVRFAENQQALTQAGIDNPQSFTVNGEVTGLHLINTNEQSAGAQSPSSQTS